MLLDLDNIYLLIKHIMITLELCYPHLVKEVEHSWYGQFMVVLG